MRLTVLHNPKAGDAEVTADELRDLLQSAGHAVTYQSIKKSNWTRVLEERCDLVVAIGGDGTVSKAARELAGSGVPLAIVPTGTANNIARSLGVSGELPGLVGQWETGVTRALDLGVASTASERMRFVEAVGMGAFARLIGEGEMPKEDMSAPEELDAAMALAIRFVQEAQPVRCELQADDRELSGDYLAVEIMNIRSIGPLALLAPDAMPGDGLLDIVAITEHHRRALVEYLERLRAGVEGSMPVPAVRAGSAQLTMRTADTHLDDGAWPRGRGQEEPFAMHVTVMRGAVNVVV